MVRRACLLLAVAAVAAAPTPAAAQPVSDLRGRVVDADGAPVPDAVVSLPQFQRYTLTSATGHFRLPGVTLGTHVVVVSRLGYRERTLTLSADADSLHVVVLAQQPIVLDALIVSGGMVRRELNRAAQARALGMTTAAQPPVFWDFWERDRILASGIDDPLQFLRSGPPRLVIRPCVGLGMPPDRLCVSGAFRGVPASDNAGAVRAGRDGVVFGSVFVDGRPLAAIEDLQYYSMSEFHRVEAYGWRGERGIRFYTAGYLRMVETGQINPRSRVPPPAFVPPDTSGYSTPGPVM
jgi:hypothetical protein